VFVLAAMDFRQVKLKKTVVKEAPAAPIAAICETDADYAALMEETHLETFLDKLGDVTFKTFMLPLKQEDLHRAFEQKEWRGIASLEELAAAIGKGKRERGWDLVFVRLSSRSPKDAALLNPRFRELLAKHYHSLPPKARNSKLLALYGAATEAMGCASAADAMHLLTHSNRIQDDLVSMTGLNLCVRQFVSFLPEYEIRGFVWSGKLTALTQYNQFVVSERLKKNAAAAEAACRWCFENVIAKRIELSRFAIDFVVIEQADGSFKAFVVELNPLAEFTGFGLFDWLCDQLVLQGRAPFEFRIATKEPEVLDIGPDYREILETFAW
jgi:hypothetical protein